MKSGNILCLKRQENNSDDAKLQLKALKKVIKEYEHDFFASMGRKPGKADISDNPDIGNH